jgi:hypothetical protein
MRHPSGRGVTVDARPLRIELSPAQVAEVMRRVSGSGDISMVLTGFADVGLIWASNPEILDDTRLSRSLLAGIFVMAAMPADGSYVGCSQIARTLAMTSGSAQRYLTTLVAAGLVERDPATRKYRLAHAG